MHNIILDTDSYKTSHYLQYPPGTTHINSYIEARHTKDPVVFADPVFFGLQAYINKYLLRPITINEVHKAARLLKAHGLPFNEAGWLYILEKHDGYLPITIQAVPEGIVTGYQNVQVQVRNNDANVPWLTSYMETAILRAVWYPSTVATLSRNIKQLINRYAFTSDDLVLDFKLHDFGSRGVSSKESAGLGGLAHLVNFKGTDTLEAILYAQKYYRADEMPAFSIPASEHSTVICWENETDSYKNMIQQFGKAGSLFAIVSDSYDLLNVVDNIFGKELKSQIETSGATLVVRPDSGDPVEIVEQTLISLAKNFGYTTNKKGYKVLPPCVRVIQGDGVDYYVIQKILNRITSTPNKFSVDNITFGMGGALLQQVNRDSMGYAMKASAITMKNNPSIHDWREISKRPKTDSTKTSKGGLLSLYERDGHYHTIATKHLYKTGRPDLLVNVFENGYADNSQTLADIRKRAEISNVLVHDDF